jgi:hypothetical protein
MRNPTDNGEVVQTLKGRGEITFPLGARIQSYFELTEFATGKRLLICTGRFTKASYNTWERLVSQYQMDPSKAGAPKGQPTERFEGRTDDERPLTIARMFLTGTQVSDIGQNNLTLQMQFDCQDVTLGPEAPPPTA